MNDSEVENVRFLREERRTTPMGHVAVYRIFRAPDAMMAKQFLKDRPVSEPFLYIVVETPQGNYARDIQGIYKE